MRNIYILVLFLSVCVTVKSQINLNTQHNGAQTYEIAAPESVSMKPDFGYKPEGANFFHAYIDEDIIVPVNYYEYGVGTPENPYVFDKTLMVGTTKGDFDVNNGNSSYNIPIPIPPGTSGMIPQISIFYNSGNENGMLGYGWNVSGISAITREGSNIHSEGVDENVSFTDEDKFSLDGNRLRLISGEWGKEFSLYHTEEETFSEIMLLKDEFGDLYFKVETKSGKTIKYGSSANSKLFVGADNVISWYITEVSDKRGNYIKYYYNNSGKNAPYFYITLNRIEYTGNSNTGLQPYNTIKFSYQERNDHLLYFVNGKKGQNKYIVSKIKVINEGCTVKTFEFKYFYRRFSFLSEIIEYDQQENNYNSTYFNYDDLPVDCQVDPQLKDILLETNTNGNGCPNPHAIFKDFNNGYKILTVVTDNNSYPAGKTVGSCGRVSYFKISTSPGLHSLSYLFDPLHISQPADLDYFNDATIAQLMFLPMGNFNEDNNEDYVAIGGDICLCGGMGPNTIRYQLSSQPYSIHKINIDETVSSADNISFKTADIDGDGLKDVIVAVKTGVGQYQFSAYKFHIDIGWEKIMSSCVITNITKFQFGNFDSDRSEELITENSSGSKIFKFQAGSSGSMGNFTQSFSSLLITSIMELQASDFNRDNMTDFLAFSENLADIYLSTGAGFEKHSTLSAPVNLANEKYSIADFNGDKNPDIIRVVGNVITVFTNILNSPLFEFGSRDFYVTGAGPLSNAELIFNYDLSSDQQNDIILKKDDGFYLDVIKYENGLLSIKSITNGLNYKTDIQYSDFADTDVYTVEDFCFQSRANHYGRLYDGNKNVFKSFIVKSVTIPDGIGGTSQIDYKYSGAVHLFSTRAPLLGFHSITTKTKDKQAVIVNEFLYAIQTFPIHVLVANKSTDVYTIDFNNNNSLVQVSSRIDLNYFKDYYGDNNVLFLYKQQSTNTNLITNTTSTTTFTYNDFGQFSDIWYGNLSKEETNINNGEWISSTTYTYADFVQSGSWCPSKPKKVITTKTKSGEEPYTQINEFTYCTGVNGGLITEAHINSEKNNETWTTINNSDYDSYGNALKIKSFAYLVPETTVSLVYDDKKRFVTKKSNDYFDEFTDAEYSSATGQLISIKDANGHLSQNTYGKFNFLTKTTLPSGQEINYDISWNTGAMSDPANSIYYTTQTSSNLPPVVEYFDLLGRSLRKSSLCDIESTALSIDSDTKYNSLGQVQSVSTLSPSGNELWTSYLYDIYGRADEQTLPNGSITKYTYDNSNRKTTISNTITNQWKSFSTDAAGNIIRTEEKAGEIVLYSYSSSGQVKTIQSGNNLHSFIYDDCGLKTNSDPSTGTSHYVYNAVGQLTQCTDSKSNQFTLSYDKLGRVHTIVSPEGTIAYTYDIEPNGKGLLASVSGPLPGYTHTYKYNNLSNLEQETENIDSSPFTTSYIYTLSGAVNTVTYPSGFTIQNVYSAMGYLSEVKRADNNSSIWKAESVDYNLHYDQYLTGNNVRTNKFFDNFGSLTEIKSGTLQDFSYAFDPITGNLMSRGDLKRNKTESFTYDDLDRLKTWGGQATDYLPDGRIMNKSDVSPQPYIYNSAHPYAVSQIKLPSTISSDKLETEYNSFNKIIFIENTDQNNTLIRNSEKFYYGPEQNRKKVESWIFNGSNGQNELQSRKYYSGNYEKQIDNNNATTEWHYIVGGDGLAAIYRKVNGIGSMYYVLKDHLGSITGLADASGNLVEEFSFDAWGRRRNPVTWDYLTGNMNPSTLITRGYTGHEHIDKYAIINMNGRLYDPQVGQMLSPDIVVQSSFSQNFNRYSYCLNNPLKYIDPSGWEYRWVPGRGYQWFSEGDVQEFGQDVKYDYHRHGYYDKWGNQVSSDYAISQALSIYGGTLSGGKVTHFEYAGTSQDPYQTLTGIIFADGSYLRLTGTNAGFYASEKNYRGTVLGNSSNEPASGGGVMQAGGDLPSMRDNAPDHPDYKSPKGGDRKVRNPNGKGTGWIDNKGRVWVPTDHKGTHAPHWDREFPGGGHENVYPYMNPGFNITPEDILRGVVIVGGAAFIIFDIVTIPSGEGMIGVEMIRRAVAP